MMTLLYKGLMTDQHPLTDEICRAIDDKASTKTNDWKGCMRAGADWQLEQVIHVWEQCMEEPGTDIQVIRRFDQKLKAMRPQEEIK